MRKKKIIVETGVGQHEQSCLIWNTGDSWERKTLEERNGCTLYAAKETFRIWSKEAKDIFYVLDFSIGLHQYPELVKKFQSIISKETDTEKHVAAMEEKRVGVLHSMRTYLQNLNS